MYEFILSIFILFVHITQLYYAQIMFYFKSLVAEEINL